MFFNIRIDTCLTTHVGRDDWIMFICIKLDSIGEHRKEHLLPINVQLMIAFIVAEGSGAQANLVEMLLRRAFAMLSSFVLAEMACLPTMGGHAPELTAMSLRCCSPSRVSTTVDI